MIMNTHVVRAAAALAFAAMVPDALAQLTPAPCDNCGVVATIQPVTDRQEWTPLGAVAPGTGSATFESQSGSTTMMQFSQRSQDKGGLVVVGAAGGAAYAQRPNQYRRQRWEVSVTMEKGPPRVLALSYEPLVQPGDRVRVSGNQLELFNP
jgi:hypothetical protein